MRKDGIMEHYVRKIADLQNPTENQTKDIIRFMLMCNESPDKLCRHRKDIDILKFHAGIPDECGWVRYKILASVKGYGIRKYQIDVTNETWKKGLSMVCNLTISSAKWGEYCINNNSCFMSIV